jgi:predicted nucleotidyltransferase
MNQTMDAATEALSRTITGIVLRHFPETEGIYLFGSQADGTARPDSDVDIAVLLPPTRAESVDALALAPCGMELEEVLGKPVDLLNAREVSTVMQFQLIYGLRIHCANAYAMDEFEMLTMSYYQKLNEERAEILAAFEETGRAYRV